ncbi:MAG: ABC transporter substrate-binding protein [Microbacterium sp. SCN 70-27]|uniref:endolytic transglycosylase MltG n=1 Tax=unclassified Microbacterium TaxID=2609290 RepID=UPI00086CD786|nr:MULTISPECIES: endolytic transglycosylase MltG [unclassified Microbacterium]MBN9223243.1 endolytic transglycosylase MltG [Microbacterium sp.]ODT26538.1 MAG: ABC transporter substrate-binding protein [Microbacterium sp. SCN 70-27]
MPETPPNDDQFADLFRRLPSAPARPSTEGESPAPESAPPAASAAASGSRRAARNAQRAAEAAAARNAPSRPSAAETAEARQSQTLEGLFSEPDADHRAREARNKRDRRKSRIAGWIVFAVILAILGGIVGGGFFVWNTYEDKIRAFMGWEEPKDYAEGEATGQVTVTIVSGDTGSTISKTLFDAGVTKTQTAFYDYLRSSGQDPTFFPGAYTLQQKMTSAAALAALMDPANKQEHTAQLREGLTVAQSLTILSEGLGIPLADLQAAAADPAAYGVTPNPEVVAAGGEPLEGWLFPATYTFDPGVTAQDVISTLVKRTVTSLDKAGVPVEDRQRILTIASIIQREARFEADFYKVSRVIQNRLVPGNKDTLGKLQMDSTAQYGFGEMHDGTASSSKEALEDDNPWNTYVRTGLPAGPIANPGDTAIDAAMHPADGSWLYFVTVNLETGETVFSDTYAEHQKAVAQWQEWCKANDSADC